MIVVAFLLTASSAAQAGNNEGYQAAYDAAYDKAFRASFRIRSIEQCRASAKNAAAAKIDVTPICACVTDRLLETKTVAELSAKQTIEELRLLSSACIQEHPPVAGSLRP